MPIGHAIAVAARLPARRGARQRSRAFSLAELLLTVGLIGLLMSIMLPALKRSVRQAKATVCRHNLRAIDQMMQMYRMESRGWLPHVPESDPATDAGPKPWFDQLVPRYLNDVALLICPEDPYHTILERNARANPHPDWANASSYGMSEFILGSPDSYLANLDRHSPRRPLDTIVLADMVGAGFVNSDEMVKPDWMDDEFAHQAMRYTLTKVAMVAGVTRSMWPSSRTASTPAPGVA